MTFREYCELQEAWQDYVGSGLGATAGFLTGGIPGALVGGSLGHYAQKLIQTLDSISKKVQADIINLKQNLRNSTNPFLQKLTQSEYIKDLNNILKDRNRIENYIKNTVKESFASATLGAGIGTALGGPLGGAVGGVLGHYGQKAWDYFKPTSRELRTHIKLEAQLLRDLEQLLYVLQSSKDPTLRKVFTSDIGRNVTAVVENLKHWQKYYKEGGTGEGYGAYRNYSYDRRRRRRRPEGFKK